MTDWNPSTLIPSFPDQSSDDPTDFPGYSRTTILLVDDDNGCRDVVRQILERKGFAVLSAGCPDQAIKIATEASRIDLLISDVVMPGQNGFELYEQLQMQMPRLPVLFISGYPIIPPCLEKEDTVVNFLLKPFRAEKLLDMVHATLLPQ